MIAMNTLFRRILEEIDPLEPHRPDSPKREGPFDPPPVNPSPEEPPSADPKPEPTRPAPDQPEMGR